MRTSIVDPTPAELAELDSLVPDLLADFEQILRAAMRGEVPA